MKNLKITRKKYSKDIGEEEFKYKLYFEYYLLY